MAENTRFYDITKAFIDRIEANWDTLPVIRPNDSGFSFNLTNGFVAIVREDMDSRPASINGYAPLVRTSGVMTFKVFVPHNTGVKDGDLYASEISEIFTLKQFSGVTCFAASIDSGAQIKYNNNIYWLTTVMCPYYYDAHVTL